ncbi:UNVERIFIED_ORG: ATP-binding cassette subfamily B protein [Microbispora rosea subsp. rosea]
MTRQPPPAHVRRLRLGADLVSGNGLAVALAVLLALASTAATLSVPLLVKELVEALTGHAPIGGLLAATSAVSIGGAFAGAASAYGLTRLGERLVLGLRSEAMEHALRLPMRTVGEQGPGNLVARITSDAVLLRSVVDVGVVQLPVAGITVLFSLVVMALIDWVMVLITIASFAVAAVAIGVVMVRSRRGFVQVQEATGQLAQRFTTALTSLPTIKAYCAEAATAASLAEDAGALTRKTLSAARLQSLVMPVLGLGQEIALVSIVIAGGARMGAGALSMSGFVAFLLYLLQLIGPVTTVVTGMSRLQVGLAARSRFEDLLNIPQERDDEVVAPPFSPAHAPAVEFADVGFAYDGHPALNGVTFSAPSRGVTALVGHSGAGKSTVLGLVERFNHADRGAVRVLGSPIEDWPLRRLRGNLAYVDQSFTLVEGSVRDNLLLGAASPADDEIIMATLESVDLRQVVLDLPDGLDTVIGRGVDLSGGQRQRLALARALLSDAAVILLDEPTSQLDGVNELRLRDVIDRLARERAVVVVAHRLSTIQQADQVVVMDGGTVVDAGAHSDLMSRCEHYRQLVHSQQWHDLQPVGAAV